MYALLLILFVFVALLMTLTILMQSSKGGGLAASFGGLGSSGVLGPRGAANFLQKATTFLAVTYGLLCMIIGFIGRPTSEEGGSVIRRGMQQQQEVQSTLPVAPLEYDESGQPFPQQPAAPTEEEPAETPEN
jgi:preprotein translocase subunit SecG